MRTHVTVIAWLNILLSSLILITGFMLFIGCVVLGTFAWPVLPFFGSIGIGLLLVCALFSIPGLILGWGMLNYAPWARIFGIVVSILHLIHPLFGAGQILGIYGLVVLFHPETVALFEGRQVQTN